MLRDVGSQTVKSDGTITWSFPGVAFQIVPSRVVRGHYPLRVVLDNDANRVVRLEGTSEERGGAFSSVRLEGGFPGDEWRLFVAEDAGSLRRIQTRADCQGYGVVRNAPGAILAQVDFTSVGSLPVDGAPGKARLYLRPRASGFVFVEEPSMFGGPFAADDRMWDVRQYARHRFTYECDGLADVEGGGPAQFGFIVEGFVRCDARARPIFSFGLGSVNNFAAGSTLGAGGTVARLELGSSVNDSAPLLVRSTERANFLRVMLVKTAQWALPPNFQTTFTGDLGSLQAPASGFLSCESF